MLWILANQGHPYTPKIYHSFLLENMGVGNKRVKKREWEVRERSVQWSQGKNLWSGRAMNVYFTVHTLPFPLPSLSVMRNGCFVVEPRHGIPPPFWLWHTISFYFCLCFYDPCPGASIWPLIGTITPSKLFHLPRWPPVARGKPYHNCRGLQTESWSKNGLLSFNTDLSYHA